MKAVRWHARGDARVDEVDAPGRPGPGDVLLRVLLCGVCGTDLEEVRAGPVAVPPDDAPLVLGHEVLGEVVAVGDGVTGLQVGDRVVPNGLFSCGECADCLAGRPTLCARLSSIGLQRDGGMAEQLTVPAWMCAVVPDGVPDRVAILAEPLSVCVRGLRRGQLTADDRVVVIGGGTIGQCAIQLAVHAGASVGLADTHPERFAVSLAAAPGLAEIPADAENIADCVLLSAGSETAFMAAARMVAPGGRIVLLGAPLHAPEFSPLALQLKEVDIISSLSHDLDEDLRPAIALLASGELHLDHVVTETVPLAEALRVFEPVVRDGRVHFKTVIDPRQ
jgi:(R,R)-butanediol dehydrogenase/meso-butanediol dehydrogenase/diacetyl reductase